MSVDECIAQLKSGHSNVQWARTFRARLTTEDAKALTVAILECNSSSLESLQLHYSTLVNDDTNNNTNDTLRAFIPALTKSGMKELSFQGTSLHGSAEGLAEILHVCATDSTNTIERLTFSESEFKEDEFASKIGPALFQFQGLQALSLSTCFTPNSTSIACILPFLPSGLMSLDLSNIRVMGSAPAMEWDSLKRMENLEELNLSGTSISTGNGFAQALGVVSKTGKFKRLTLPNSMSATDTKVVLAQLDGKSLEKLIMSDSSVGDHAIPELVTLLSSCSSNLSYLDFSSCGITTDGAKSLAPMLSPSNLGGLEVLKMGFNLTRDEGAMAILGECLTNASCLRELELYNMGLTEMTANNLLEILQAQKARALEEIYMEATMSDSDNQISRKMLTKIRQAIELSRASISEGEYSDGENH